MPTLLWPLDHMTRDVKWSVKVMCKTGISSFLTWRRFKSKLLMLHYIYFKSYQEKTNHQWYTKCLSWPLQRLESSTKPDPTSPWTAPSFSPRLSRNQVQKGVYVHGVEEEGRQKEEEIHGHSSPQGRPGVPPASWPSSPCLPASLISANVFWLSQGNRS